MNETLYFSFVSGIKCGLRLHPVLMAVYKYMQLGLVFKEQSLCPRVLLCQTKPEGLPEGEVRHNKTREQGDYSYYSTFVGSIPKFSDLDCLNQQTL